MKIKNIFIWHESPTMVDKFFLAKPEIQKNFYDVKEDKGKIEICA